MITKQDLKNYLIKKFPDKFERRFSVEAWLIHLICGETGTVVSDRLRDISTHGCISGTIGELVYTSDCLRFYAKYEEKIWESVSHFLEMTGQTLGQFLDSFAVEVGDYYTLKVKLAWFAVEESAYRLLNRFETERMS